MVLMVGSTTVVVVSEATVSNVISFKSVATLVDAVSAL